MATERGNLFVSGLKARNQFKQASRGQAAADWQASRAGTGTTPLSEFESNKNTRYAMNNVGWDKAQGLRRKAEAADGEAGVTPPSSGQWDRRYNYTTDEMEWIQKDPSNFWKANKDELIRMGGAVLGTILLPGAGTMLGAQLAGTARDIYKMRDARRDFKSDKRQAFADLVEHEKEVDAYNYQHRGANLFRSGGEGVVEYATKDRTNKKKDQYIREI